MRGEGGEEEEEEEEERSEKKKREVRTGNSLSLIIQIASV